ncbi:RGS domain-containing protein [Dipodascopsis tothii]|uniref:RGS domain-containing protein n=1 Tax=Dipodascopsis tothii TaxID=44089 RepID=UPI0034CFA5ED
MTSTQHDGGAPRRQPRLPTLFEVLNRKTRTPVDLFSFYVFMRDQQRSVDYLDFWLDVAQHVSLCRHYVRQLRRSILLATPEGERESSKHSSLILEGILNESVRGSPLPPDEKEGVPNRRLSEFLRSEGSADLDEYMRRNDGRPERRPVVSDHMLGRRRASGRESALPVVQEDRTAFGDAEADVSRKNIRESAYHILVTYFTRGAERELALPVHIMHGVMAAIEIDNRDDPEVFEEARDYVFHAMERDAYPYFLRYKALANLVPAGSFARLAAGLFGIFAAFWTAFTLILLDYQPKRTRAWIILPFAVGVYGLTAYQYNLDPLVALAGYSEITFGKLMKVREPYVKELLVKRALWVMAVNVVVVTCLCVLFGFVPGRRL